MEEVSFYKFVRDLLTPAAMREERFNKLKEALRAIDGYCECRRGVGDTPHGSLLAASLQIEEFLIAEGCESVRI